VVDVARTEPADDSVEAATRLAEGWCPNTRHGRLVPAGEWGRCDGPCGGFWRRATRTPCLTFQLVDGDRFVEQDVDVYILARVCSDADDILERAVHKARSALQPANPVG
jgi:hypothetical protein